MRRTERDWHSPAQTGAHKPKKFKPTIAAVRSGKTIKIRTDQLLLVPANLGETKRFCNQSTSAGTSFGQSHKADKCLEFSFGQLAKK